MRPMSFTTTLLSTTALVLACSGAHAQETKEVAQPAAAARDGDKIALDEIIVTATRRATNVQDVSTAVTAVAGEQLARQGITDAVQLARITPNLFATSGYAGGNTRFAIRGLGATDFSQAGASPVAIYIDDVYQPYSFGIGSQLFDLDRVEVLRGPQGTLFGKNTTGGAVAYYSARPQKQLGGYVNADLITGEYNKRTLEGVLNTPISDTLAARFDLRYENRDAYVRNVFNGQDLGENRMLAGRAQFEWTPSDATRVNLKLFGMRSNGDATLYHGGFVQNICDPARFDPTNTPYANCNGSSLPKTYEAPGEVNDETQSFEKYSNSGLNLRIDQDAGDWSLTAITGYQKIDYKIRTNDDGNATDFFGTRQDLHAWQISQEVRAASPAGRRLSGVFGLFAQYDRAKAPTSTGSVLFGPPRDNILRDDADQKTQTLAAFTNVTFKIDERFSVIGGLRYSSERKKVDIVGLDVFSGGYDFTDDTLIGFDIAHPPFVVDPAVDVRFGQHETNTWNRATWDLTLNYKPSDDALLYVKAAEGFRSGGYNLFASTPDAIATVRPEILRSYEAGAKLEFFDNRLRLNSSGFYYELSDQQILSTGASGAGVKLSNAGSSTVKGFEVEAEAAVVAHLRLSGSLGYTDARFDEYHTLFAGQPISLAGHRLAYAPKWTASTSAAYDFDLSNGYNIRLSTDWNYRSKVYFDAYNFSYTGDGSLVLGNARISLTAPAGPRQWHLDAYVNNLTDQKYHVFGFFTGTAWYSRVYSDRRLFGLQAGVKF
ncbi:outer membrane receptor protein [Caulobacter sp. AP07]|uniref:TonB-dependent receptor n=1 Tax=Caulobacter sp. AP07 TaxID=1144304 RepID=UPI000271EDDE|nr:TonB-dependent receptor [Caulobacter sp. AP07]EJL30806.1 outer membrane receptor protein [Caulobacter sp. AP07]